MCKQCGFRKFHEVVFIVTAIPDLTSTMKVYIQMTNAPKATVLVDDDDDNQSISSLQSTMSVKARPVQTQPTVASPLPVLMLPHVPKASKVGFTQHSILCITYCAHVMYTPASSFV
jgi:hypothetical protein